ncbi:hypothetical protein LCGC14_2644980 [marine sediment metagenome]|uniref:Uncharacterized protein n=1 Tax=marine sediment metagenome TaxID=412755 RepID=A0A0F9C6X6_9ZZZZ
MVLVRFAALFVVLFAAACTTTQSTPPALGDFRLGHNVVLAQTPQKGPFSRDATSTELTTALSRAIEQRLDVYDGNGLYHLGVSIGGYVLAQPGVPVVYTPKSVLIFDVTLYDNATQQKLNEQPFRITAFEGLQNTAPVIGSGLARSKEEQLANLAVEGARSIQNWLRRNPEWFTPDPTTPRTPFDRAQRAAPPAVLAPARRAAPTRAPAATAPRRTTPTPSRTPARSSAPIVDPVAEPVPTTVTGVADVPMMAPTTPREPTPSTTPSTGTITSAPLSEPAPAPAPAPAPTPAPAADDATSDSVPTEPVTDSEGNPLLFPLPEPTDP